MAQQDYANLYGVFSTDFDVITQHLAETYGNGVISGLAVSQRGAGANMSVDVAAGEARANGTIRNFGSTTNVVITASSPSNPRKDLIVINSAGTLVARAGTAEAITPSGQVRRFTLTPTPPEMTAGDLVLAEVWVAAGATQILDADISSRTILAIEGSDVNPTTLQPDNVVSSGTSDELSRRDHLHGIAAATAVSTGNANAEGSSTSFSRADHVHLTNAVRFLAQGSIGTGNLDVTIPSGYSKLLIFIRYNAGGTATPFLQFNSDTGSNYYWKYMIDNATPVTGSGSTGMSLHANQGGYWWAIITIHNESTIRKLVSWQIVDSPSTAGIPDIVNGSGVWNNTSAQITTIRLDGAVTLNAEMTVFGWP